MMQNKRSILILGGGVVLGIFLLLLFSARKRPVSPVPKEPAIKVMFTPKAKKVSPTLILSPTFSPTPTPKPKPAVTATPEPTEVPTFVPTIETTATPTVTVASSAEATVTPTEIPTSTLTVSPAP